MGATGPYLWGPLVHIPLSLPDSRDNVPDSRNNVPDSRDNVPDSRDNVPDSRDNVPDSQDNVPDSRLCTSLATISKNGANFRVELMELCTFQSILGV